MISPGKRCIRRLSACSLDCCQATRYLRPTWRSQRRSANCHVSYFLLYLASFPSSVFLSSFFTIPRRVIFDPQQHIQASRKTNSPINYYMRRTLPSYPTSVIMRLLSRHPIRFLGISTIVALTFLWNFAGLTERDRPTYSSRIWGSVVTNSQQRTLEPKLPYKSNDDIQHIKQTHHTLQLQPHQSWTVDLNKLSLEELRAYTAGKNGYYVRDWSLGLGWNNVSS